MFSFDRDALRAADARRLYLGALHHADVLEAIGRVTSEFHGVRCTEVRQVNGRPEVTVELEWSWCFWRPLRVRQLKRTLALVAETYLAVIVYRNRW